MQAPINKELAALMQLQSAGQAIKTLLSSGVAPGTVAAQKVQETAALTQAAPQSPAAPPGIAALLPGVQQQLRQAQAAAQPATQGDVNQLRQMMAQAAPSQMESGVGGLGQDIQMAEGGVVGYAGLDGSEVELDDTKLSVGERFRRDMRRLYERTGLSAKRAEYLQRTGAPPEVIAQTLAAESAAPTTAPTVATDTGDEYDKLRSRYKRPTTPQEIEAQVKAQPGTSYQPEARLFSSAAQGRKEIPKERMPADTGVASLMGPSVPSGSERQFAEALAAQARMEIPAERTEQQIRKQTEDYYRSLGIDPDFAKQRMSRIEAQEARDRAEAAERAKLVEGRGMENLISRLTRAGGARSGLAGLAQAQLGMEPIIAAQRVSDERFNAVMRERQMAADKERTATEDMQRALADGDIAKAEKSRNEALAARNAKNEMEAKNRAQYAPQMLQAETAAMQEASRAKEGAANRANALELERMRRATAGMPGEAERIEAQFNRLKAQNPAEAEAYLQRIERIKGLGRPTDRAVLTYAQAAKIVDERLSELGTQYALNKEEADAAKRENRTPRTLAQMREDLIRKEMAMAGGLAGSAAPSGGQAPASGASSAPAVGTIMQGYRFKGGNPADKNNWEKV